MRAENEARTEPCEAAAKATRKKACCPEKKEASYHDRSLYPRQGVCRTAHGRRPLSGAWLKSLFLQNFKNLAVQVGGLKGNSS